jgi:hypothetical protein
MVAHKVEPTQCRFGGTPQGLCVPFTRRGAVTRRPRLQGGRAEPRRRPEASRCAHRQRGGSGGRGELYEPDIPWRVMAGLRTRRRARSDPAARLLNRLPRCRRARAAIRDLNVVHHQSLPQPLEATDHQKRARPHARRAAPKVARPFLPLLPTARGDQRCRVLLPSRSLAPARGTRGDRLDCMNLTSHSFFCESRLHVNTHTHVRRTAVKTIQYKAGLPTETHAGRELRYSQRKRRRAGPTYELGRECARQRGR